MAFYLKYVKSLAEGFTTFDLVHVLREHNSRIDLLSKLACSGRGRMHQTMIQETLKISRVIVGDPKEDCLKVIQILIEDT